VLALLYAKCETLMPLIAAPIAIAFCLARTYSITLLFNLNMRGRYEGQTSRSDKSQAAGTRAEQIEFQHSRSWARGTAADHGFRSSDMDSQVKPSLIDPEFSLIIIISLMYIGM
jgi:hypothetical protein